LRAADWGQRINPPIRLRTNRPTIGPARSVAIDPAAEVTPEALVGKRVVKNTRTPIKILGDGDLDKALTVRMHLFSASARAKIEAAGGTVELL
jgi:large subunit ribosomal protein L15